MGCVWVMKLMGGMMGCVGDEIDGWDDGIDEWDYGMCVGDEIDG